jgi:hypothetical protein
VYGLPDEVQGNPQTWGGRSVAYRAPIFGGAGDPDPFGGGEGISQRVEGTVKITGDGIYVTDGPITSVGLGLSLEYHNDEPLAVSSIAGQLSEVTVKVSGR